MLLVKSFCINPSIGQQNYKPVLFLATWFSSSHAGKTELNWCDKNLCSKKRTEGKFVGICYRICRDKFRDFHKVSLKTGPKPV